MSSPASTSASHLNNEIAEAQRKQSGLSDRLREIELEIEGLHAQSAQFTALGEACNSLERLEELGIAELFWGEGSVANSRDAQVQAARLRIDDFNDKFDDAKARYEALRNDLKQGQDVLDILEDELYEEQLREEEKKREWATHREVNLSVQGRQLLPWMHTKDDEDRFRKTLATALLVSLVLGLVIPMIDLPIPQREELVEVPERLARLIRQEPPPVQVVEEVLPTPVEPEPEPQQTVDEVDPETPPEPVVANDVPVEEAVVEPPPGPPVDNPAPEDRVRSTGILAFRESFSNLASDGPAAQLGAEARFSTAGEAAVGRTTRSMVATDGPGSSGGINLADLSRNVGGGGGGAGDDIAGVQVTRVASSIGGGGTGNRPLAGGSVAGGRTDEEIQIVFDRYKSALYRLYNRELRNDPTLRGQVVLQLTIEPDGSVSFCEMQSSDMDAPALIEQVVERVKTFDFGAKENIPPVTILYPIDFLPAA